MKSKEIEASARKFGPVAIRALMVGAALQEPLKLCRHIQGPRPVAIKLVIGDTLQFASTTNDCTGWSQIARSVESAVRNLTAQ